MGNGKKLFKRSSEIKPATKPATPPWVFSHEFFKVFQIAVFLNGFSSLALFETSFFIETTLTLAASIKL